MENIFEKFPNLGGNILHCLDNKSLAHFKKVRRRWMNFTDQQKTFWIRLIEKHIGKNETFTDDWKKVVFKTPVQVVKELAVAVKKFYKSYENDLFSPLFIAAEQGNLGLTQYIIGKVEDKEWKDSEGYSPLYIAAQEGHLEIYRIIMENVLDKNPANNEGYTPLYIAAENGHLKICKLIIKNVKNKT